MSDGLLIMAAPLAACLVILSIHAYLGLHVLERGVIFVDLALAQLAALGTTAAFLLGQAPGEWGAYACGLGFAVAGGVLFALLRSDDERVPQEALIGVVYAVASAAAILLVDRAPHGSEHLKEILVGQILWVGWGDIAVLGALYAAVGALHYRWRVPLLRASKRSRTDGLEVVSGVRRWDLLFYCSFAAVITASVQVAGVLLVFSFLIVPAIVAVLYRSDLSSRLRVAWATGALASVIGCLLSYALDLPTGAAIVCTFGVLLAGAAARAGAVARA